MKRGYAWLGANKGQKKKLKGDDEFRPGLNVPFLFVPNKFGKKK